MPRYGEKDRAASDALWAKVEDTITRSPGATEDLVHVLGYESKGSMVWAMQQRSRLSTGKRARLRRYFDGDGQPDPDEPRRIASQHVFMELGVALGLLLDAFRSLEERVPPALWLKDLRDIRRDAEALQTKLRIAAQKGPAITPRSNDGGP